MKNSEIELLIKTAVCIYRIRYVNFTPTYISINFQVPNVFPIIIHYNKQLIKFEGRNYTDYNLSEIHDNILKDYINGRVYRVYYYPDEKTRDIINFALRDSRVDKLMD